MSDDGHTLPAVLLGEPTVGIRDSSLKDVWYMEVDRFDLWRIIVDRRDQKHLIISATNQRSNPHI